MDYTGVTWLDPPEGAEAVRHPVYPFRAILRELRQDAGLTILAAAESTEYGNYERWESGATRVAPQHLRSIRDAFAITDQLGLFIYAWLVDRFSPKPGQGSVDLARANVGKSLRQLPGDVVDLGEYKHWVAESARHADIAQLYLVARYGRRRHTVLPPVARSPLPTRPDGKSVLEAAYGDVVLDAIRLVARTLITSALRSKATADETERVMLASLAPMLASPKAFDAMADELACPFEADVRRFVELLRAQHAAMAAIVEGATGTPATTEAVADLATDVAAGRLDHTRALLEAAATNDALPAIEPALTRELEAMHDRVVARWEEQARRELAEQSARLDVDGLFDALDVIADAATVS